MSVDCPFCCVELVKLDEPITGTGQHVGSLPAPVKTWTHKCPRCKVIYNQNKVTVMKDFKDA